MKNNTAIQRYIIIVLKYLMESYGQSYAEHHVNIMHCKKASNLLTLSNNFF